MAGLVLGCVLVAAGVLKARDPAWPRTATRFGTPTPVAAGLPWTEIVLGALLVVDIGRPLVATAAFLLLTTFTVVVARRLFAGDTVPCGCFGSVGPARPISWMTLVRNVGLMGLAAVAIASTN